MSNFTWPTDDGWPYPDGGGEAGNDATDHTADLDEDLIMLRSRPAHLYDDLNEVERRVIRAHYGLDGQAPRSMKQLHAELGLSRAELREALGSGLHKLRSSLRD